MPFVYADRVKETTTTTGTGSITLAGAVTGFRTFSSTIGSFNSTIVVIANATGSEWELSRATLLGSTLSRDTVLASSNGGSLVNFSAGTKTVFVTLPAQNGSTTFFGNQVSFASGGETASTAFGANTGIRGNYATALGAAADSGVESTTVGYDAQAPYNRSVAIGYGSRAATASPSYYGSVALGYNAQATGERAVAVGQNATAANSVDVAVGADSYAAGGFATAIGTYAYANYGYSTVLGNAPSATTNDQFIVRVRQNPSGVDTTYSLKYDQYSKEIYATSAGGGLGVTQIIAGTGISITSTGPSGTGVVTINATGGGGGYDWITVIKSPLPGTIDVPTNFTSMPGGPAYMGLFGYISGGGSISPSGPWSFGSNGGWSPQSAYYVSGGSWSAISPTYAWGFGSNGMVLNYVQYPAGHMMVSYSDLFGSIFGWSNNVGGSINLPSTFPSGGSQKLYGVIAIMSGPDISSSIIMNPSYPGLTKSTTYDTFTGTTLLAFENTDAMQVFNMLNSGANVAAWPSGYSYYGHIWYEWS